MFTERPTFLARLIGGPFKTLSGGQFTNRPYDRSATQKGGVPPICWGTPPYILDFSLNGITLLLQLQLRWQESGVACAPGEVHPVGFLR